jgi:hypothetical protein
MKRIFLFLDSVGSVGALVAALACPACFPIFAALSAALGFGVFRPFEGIVFYVFQAFALLTLIGLTISCIRHRRLVPVLLGLVGVGLLAYAFYYSYSVIAVYLGLLGLVVATIWNHFMLRCKRVILESVITCPACGHSQTETMPTNACLFFYDCSACGARLKPKSGDCCVFCSYGSVPCPPIQSDAACCK